MTTVILSLGHPLSSQQIAATAALLSVPDDSIRAVHVGRQYSFDKREPSLTQQALDHLVTAAQEAGVDLTRADQARQVILILPGVSSVAGIVVALFHGLAGFFPTIARLGQPKDGFPVEQIIDLHDARTFVGRAARYHNQ